MLDLKKLGLLGEPSLDMDFSSTLYITDSGGIFGGTNNLRDKVDGKNLFKPTHPKDLGKIFNPQKEPMILLSTHPERWPDGFIGLVQASIIDWGVNLAKRIIRFWRK